MSENVAGAKLSQQLAFALQALGGGDYALAQSIANRILTASPKHPDALHVKGLACFHQKEFQTARELLNQVIDLYPSQNQPLLNRARILTEMGLLQEAVQDVKSAINLEPEDVAAYLMLGRLYRRLGEHLLAVPCLEHYLAHAPADYKVHFNLGNAFHASGQIRQAIGAYQAAIRIAPDFTDAWFNLGTLFLQLGKHDEAIDGFKQLLLIQPHHMDGYINLGNAFKAAGDLASALDTYQQALLLDRTRAPLYHNIAAIHQSEGEYGKAIANFRLAIDLDPNEVAYFLGLANSLKSSGNLSDALVLYDEMVVRFPDNVEVHTSRSLCLLLSGDYAQGFREYEWRWQSPDLADIRPNFEQPCWTGKETLMGKRLLLRWEQGLGDSIQFSRYVRLLKQQGAVVILQIQSALISLFQEMEGVSSLISNNQPVPDFDFYIPLLSLPLALNITSAHEVPSFSRYLVAPASKVDLWKERFGEHQRLRVGLAWSGRAQHKNDKNRSMTFAVLQDALPQELDYFVLQKDIRPEDLPTLQSSILAPKLISQHFDDFADTAAAIMAMDLVLTVDTSIAHLAGALGKPVWLLLPFVPDWRWGMHGDTTSWYPSIRLFRQHDLADWSSVLSGVRQALTQNVKLFKQGREL